jgi:predicted GH43/DUF377 family glycosyl hydrolase
VERRAVVGPSLVVAAFMAAIVLTAPAGSAQEQQVWTGRTAFSAGMMLDTNVSSSGSLVLASHAVNWTKFAGNPVVKPTQGWDSGWTLAPDVLYDGGLYKMWYQGCVGACDVGYATSTDGVTWTPYGGNPVLTANASSWDTTLGNPHVIHDGSVYRMWYAGDGPLAIRIGYATSPDGIHWTKYGSWPVFNGTLAWDSAAVTGPAVVKSGSTFIMYFSGHPGNYDYSMGRATSTDGVNWTEYAGNPVMTYQTSTWEQTRVHPNWFSIGTSGYDLYYTGGAPGGVGGVGHATSPDGITWTKDPANPVLTAGTPGTWDGSSVAAPYLATVGGELRMYYSGYNTTSTSVLQIGYAVWSPTGTAYASLGTWVSAVFDSGDPNTTWLSLSWTGTTPPNTGVAASAQVGSTSVPTASWVLSTPSLTSPVSLSLPKARYALVIVALLSSDGVATPTFDAITLTFERPAPAGATSSAYGGLGLLGIVLLIALAVAMAVAFLAIVLLAKRSRPSPTSRSSPTGSSFCVHCGSPLPSGNRFCGTCGAAVLPPAGPPPPGP